MESEVAVSVAPLVTQSSTDLVGYWRFDEGTGSVVGDSSGFGNAGQITNATWDTNGRSGSGLSFNGTNSFVSIPQGTWNQGIERTYSVWYRNSGSPTGVVFDHLQATSVVGSFAFNTYEYRFLARSGNGTWVGTAPYYEWSAPGQWMMATVVVTTNEIKVYKNGTWRGTYPNTGGIPIVAGPLHVGARAGSDNHFKGTIDELSIYRVALSDAQVAALYEAPPSPSPTNGGLIGKWAFNEGTGTIAGDSSGRSNVGQLTNATWDPNGRSGSCLYFNGTNAKVTVLDGTWNQSSPVTYSFWYKPDGTAQGMVIDHALSGAGAGRFAFVPAQYRFAAYDGSGADVGPQYHGGPSSGTWAMVTVVVTNTALTVYRNGVAVGSSTITGGIPYVPGALHFGARGSAGDNFFKGWIDDVSIFNRALTSVEVKTLYDETGLIGRWTFDEGSGATALDSSGLGNHGQITNATWDANGRYGSALYFNGTNARVGIPDGTWNRGSPATYSFWYKPDGTAKGFALEHAFTGAGGGRYAFWAIDYRFSGYDGSGVGRGVPYYAGPASGTWALVTAVVSSTQMRVFKDGVLLGTTPITGGFPYVPGSLYFGARGEAPDNFFKGWMDHVLVYDGVLSDSEVQALWADQCPTDPAKTTPGICGCGVSDADSDADGTVDCQELTNGQGPCLTNADCAAGLTCGFGIGPCFGRPATEGTCWDPAAPPESCCRPNCGAPGSDDRCGGICPPCVAGADSDGDGLLDCDEREDGDPWTGPLVFNGVDAQRGNSCHATPACADIDTLEEVENCFAPVEQNILASGWDFTTTARNVCDAGFGFAPSWTNCGTDFGVRYSAAIKLEHSGLHCFAVNGSVNAQCAALVVGGISAVTSEAGASCYEMDAGLYPIEWFYETTSTSLNELRVRYCFGAASPCTPEQPLPPDILRRADDANDSVCGGTCTELCPCGPGGATTEIDHCLPGLVVRTDVAEYFGLPSGTPVCWDPIGCDRNSELFECGTPDARCGSVCPTCTAACDGRSCGYNGCWGRCGDGLCGDGELGCESDADCEGDLTCVLATSGYNACRPKRCNSPALNPCSDPANAGLQTECGTCPACPNTCGDRNCGFDECGHSCGQEGAGSFCSDGYVAPQQQIHLDREAPVDGPTTVGTLPGSLVVSDFGQATYSIPLQLPPGRNGIEPQLALSYSSGAGNGYLGVGWGLTGLSAIQRCPKTLSQDGEVGGITYTDDDRFCLDGQRLVLQDENTVYGANGTFYRTEIDSFSRIESKRGEGQYEPHAFEVRTRDGRIMTYGLRVNGNTPLTGRGLRVPNYTETSSNAPRSHTWALTEVRDRVGNAMRIDYFMPAQCRSNNGTVEACDSIVGGTVREYYPKRIRYASVSNSAITLGSDREILFQYRPRTDVLAGYQYGVRFERTQLLEWIVASVQGRTAFSYHLEYGNEPAVDSTGNVLSADLHKRSLLTSVRQCARASVDSTAPGPLSTCKPPTVFEYGDNVEPGFEAAESIQGAGFPDVSDADADFVGRPVTLDLDGNGQDDVLYPVCIQDSSCTRLAWRLLLNGQAKGQLEPQRMIVEGLIPQSRTSGRAPQLYQKTKVPAVVYVVDLDLDGRDELLEVDVAFRRGKDGHPVRHWRWDGVAEAMDVGPLDIDLRGPAGLDSNLYVLDADGDGAVDIVDCTPAALEQPTDPDHPTAVQQGRWTVRRGEVGSFLSPELLTVEGPRCLSGMPIDLNGDGAQDLLLNATSLKAAGAHGAYIYYELPTTTDAFWPLTGELTRGVLPASNPAGLRTLLDVNGDGLADVVEFDKHHRTRVWTNTGTGFVGGGWHDLDLSAFDNHYDGATFLRQLRRFATPFDQNGDGRSDLLVRVKAPPASGSENVKTWAVLRARGDARNPFEVEDVLPAGLDLDAGNHLVVFDHNHDGLSDLLEQVSVRHRRRASAPRLTAVTNGLGARAAVDYQDLSDDSETSALVAPSVYDATPLPTECEYPCYRRHPRGAVVRRTSFWDTPYLANSQGSYPPSARSFRYQYGDAAVDLRGRGSLGFAFRHSVDEAREQRVLELQGVKQFSFRYYANTFRDDEREIYPFVGFATSEGEQIEDGPDHKRVHITVRTPSIDRPTARSIFPHAGSEREIATEGATTGPALTFLRDVVQTSDYDDYGNLRVLSTEWISHAAPSEGDVEASVVVETTPYVTEDHVARWLINLPSFRSTRSERGGFSDYRSELYSYFENGDPGNQFAFTGLPAFVNREPLTAQQLVTLFEQYDPTGLPTRVSTYGATVDGTRVRTVQTAYDARHMFPISQTDPKPHVVNVTHDPVLGVPIATKEEIRDGVAVSQFMYPDGFGRPRSAIDPEGISTTITYQARDPEDGGYRVTQSRPASPSVTVDFDVIGRERRRTFQSREHTLTTLTDYNALGLPAQVSRRHAEGNVAADFTVYEYDSFGRPLRVNRPGDEDTEHCYRNNVSCTRDPMGYSRCTVADAHGGIAYSVDPPANTPEACQFAADDVASTFPFDDSPLPSDRRAMHYRYGSFDTVTAIVDPREVETAFVYDPHGRVLRQIDPSRGEWQWTYNSFGEVETETNGKDESAVLRYDELGRLTSRTEVSADSSPVEETLWFYDTSGILPPAYGQLTTTVSPDGVWRNFGYDDVGRPSKLQTIIPNEDGSIELMTKEVDYADGRVRTITYDGLTDTSPKFRTRYWYDSLGYLARVYGTDDPEPTAEFDPTEDETYWVRQEEDEDGYGQLLGENFGNGVRTTRSFEPGTARLATLMTARQSDTALNYVYRYHADGHLKSRVDAVGYDGTNYTYDELGRLKLVQNTVGVFPSTISEEGFEYDEVGNIDYRTFTDGGGTVVRDYHYDTAHPDRLLAVAVEDVPVRNYGYDDNGNSDSSAWHSGPVVGFLTTTYNRRTMPMRIESVGAEGATTSVEYRYDANNVRVLKRTAAAETFYIDDAYQRTRVSGTSGAEERVLVFAEGRSVAEILRSPGGSQETSYLHEDHLGSVEAITNAAGQLIERRKYEAFGKRQVVSPAASNPTHRDYTGHEFDPEFGLVNMKARLYDPEIGRFLQADPIIASPSSSQGFNAYSYASNSPLSMVDPLGTDCRRIDNGQPCEEPPRDCNVPGECSGGGGDFWDLVGLKFTDEDIAYLKLGNREYRCGDGTCECFSGCEEAKGKDESKRTDGDDTRARGGSERHDARTEVGSSVAPSHAAVAPRGWQEFAKEWNSVITRVRDAVAGPSWVRGAPVFDPLATMYLPENEGFAAFNVLSMVLLRGTPAARGGAALDANALIRAIEGGEAAAVDAALAGRTPIVSITAAKEFLRKGDAGALRTFLAERGGRVAAAGSEQSAAALRSQAQALGRGLKVKDSRVAASAVREGVPVITRDGKFQRFLNAVGIGGVGF